MADANVPHPPIVSRDEWKTQRVAFLNGEKRLTQEVDRVNAERRRLPMVRVEKTYTFEGPEGPVTLLDLFEGRRQLIVYHFMFDPSWDKGCDGCTGLVDALGDLSMLADRQTTFVLISRAPLVKLQAYRAKKGWDWRWVSSNKSDFNYDFHATLDAAVAPFENNFRDEAEERKRIGPMSPLFKGETHGNSVFFRIDDEVFHTYSCFARGCEHLTNSYALLDITPYGRQEDFEESPAGWPQKPTYG